MPQTPVDPYGKTVPLRSYAPPASGMPWWVIPILAVFLVLFALGLLFGYILISDVSGAASAIFGRASTPSGSPVSIPAIGGKQPRSASAVADDFMWGLKEHNSLEAYNNFDTTVLVLLTPLDFERQAKHADICYGAISHYQIVVHTEGQGEAHITYDVTRKFSGTHRFPLVLLQGDEGNWAITSYGKNGTLDPPGSLPCA